MISPPIKTLLVEDSAVMRIMLKDYMIQCKSIEVIGIAHHGKQAVEMAQKLMPDVILTDLIMPRYDGVYLVKEIMQKQPIPIVMLSSLNRHHNLVFEGLNLGAFDFIEKPTSESSPEKFCEKLEQVVKAAKNASLTSSRTSNFIKNQHLHSFSSTLNYHVIAIGASTGGPSAIESIIQQIPQNLTIPIIIAQHMPHTFLQSFAARLNKTSPLPIVMLAENTIIKGGHIYIAPGNFNISLHKVSRNIVSLRNDHVYTDYNAPSINSLFESIAQVYREKSIGIILTGMGKDGVKGLADMKQKGGLTISQDEASCVVYGMPKYAKDTNASLHQIKLREIPGFIISSLN